MRRNRLRLVTACDGREDALTVHQDVTLYSSLLDAGEKLVHPMEAGRSA